MPEKKPHFIFWSGAFYSFRWMSINLISFVILWFIGKNDDMFQFFAVLNLVTGLFNIILLEILTEGKFLI